MQLITQILFLLVLIGGIAFFTRNIRRIIRNIKVGRKVDRNDHPKERWGQMARIAIGQSKMVKKPIAGILHVIVYLGFIIINIEVLEIIIDGIFGTHRILSFLGGLYSFLIGSFEILAILVLVSVVVFWIRRMILQIPRFWKKEMKGWPKNDALNILYFEMFLMLLFLIMNAADYQLQLNGAAHYVKEGGIAGAFPISQVLLPWFEGFSNASLIMVERSAWWLHIIGILIFLNYLYYSKHLHILLAFPNVYYAKLTLKGRLDNLESVTNEVKLMMDPNANPYAAPAEGAENEVPEKFGCLLYTSDAADDLLCVDLGGRR